MSGRSTERTRRGESHPCCKLTEAQVREIRDMYSEWKSSGDRRGMKTLAVTFGVSAVAIYFIVTRRTWRHV